MLRWIVLGLVAASLLFVADLAWSGWTAYDGLRTAKVDLQTGGDGLVAGELDRAEGAFQRAADAGDAAAAAFRHPALGLLGIMPWIGDDVGAGRDLSEAAAAAGHGGVLLVDAARTAGWDGQHVPGFGSDGRIDPAVIERAAPAIAQASQLLTLAATRLESIDSGDLLPPVADAVTQARGELIPRARLAQRAALATELLPGFLGADGPRTYLLVMLQPSDPRGAGGYPGMYALVTVDGHRIRLQDLQPTGSIPLVDPVDAPAEVRRRYDDRGSRIAFWDTTYSPDFPTDARLMLGIWEAAGHPPVDGVIAGDASLLSGVLEATGPVSTSSVARADQLRERRAGPGARHVSHQVATEGEPHADGRRDRALAIGAHQLVGPAADVLGHRSRRPARVTCRSTRPRPTRNNSSRTCTWTARSRSRINSHRSSCSKGLSANRAGYFARSHTTTTTRTTADGTEVTVTVRMHNDAPDGPPSQLLGLPGDGPIGQFGVEMDVYLPPGAQVLKSSVDGGPGLQLVEHEFGRPVAIQYLLADAGKTSVAVIRYLIPS